MRGAGPAYILRENPLHSYKPTTQMMGQGKRISDLEDRVTTLEARVVPLVPEEAYRRDQLALSGLLTKVQRGLLIQDTERTVLRVEVSKVLGLLKLLGMAHFPGSLEGGAELVKEAHDRLEALVVERLKLMAEVAATREGATS